MKRTYKEPEFEILEYSIVNMVGTNLDSGNIEYDTGIDGPEF